MRQTLGVAAPIVVLVAIPTLFLPVVASFTYSAEKAEPLDINTASVEQLKALPWDWRCPLLSDHQGSPLQAEG